MIRIYLYIAVALAIAGGAYGLYHKGVKHEAVICKAADVQTTNAAMLDYLTHQTTVDVTAGADNAAALKRQAEQSAKATTNRNRIDTYAHANPTPAVCAVQPTRQRLLNEAIGANTAGR